MVRRDRACHRVERGARLEQAAAEPRSRRRPADADADPGRRLDELPREREGFVLPVGGDEECRPVAA